MPAPGSDTAPAVGPLWTREFTLAAIANTLVMAIFYLLMTTMAVYAIEQFGASSTGAGLASSMFIVGAIGARLVGGQIVDAAGPRRALLISLALAVAMTVAYLPADSLTLVLVVRFAHGAAHGIAHTAVTTLAQLVIPPLRRGEGTGYFTMGAPLAAGAGPLLALWLIDTWDYEALFLACAGVSAAAWVVAAMMRPISPTAGGRSTRLRRRELVLPSVLPLATFMLLMGVATAATLTYTHPYADSSGMPGAAGAFFLAQALAVICVRLVVGRVQDRHGDNAVIYPATALFAAGIVALSLAGTTAGMVVAGVLVGAGSGMLMPTAQAAAVRIADSRHVGLAVSTYYLCLDAGAGLGPLVLGLVIGAADYRVMYLAVAGLVVVSAGYYHAVHGRYAQSVGGAARVATRPESEATASLDDEGVR